MRKNESLDSQIEKFLDAEAIHYSRNYRLAKRSLIKVGGVTNFFIEPRSKEDFINLLLFLKAAKAPFFIVGKMANILIRDGDIETVFIGTSRLKGFEFFSDGRLYTEVGESLPSLAKKLTNEGFQGFSGLTGFPASIGGAIYMNASCYAHCVSDSLLSVECMDAQGNVIVLNKSDLNLSWRYSSFHDKYREYTILSAIFHPIRATDKLAPLAHMNSCKDKRTVYQEHCYPNLGSLFATLNIYEEIAKKHKLYKLGTLILKAIAKIQGSQRRDAFWAKWIVRYTHFYFNITDVGSVGCSSKTINCIVNKDKASAKEIIDYINALKKKINIDVPLEIEIINTLK